MILFRYLSREVIVNMLAVSVTLLVIVMSGRFVNYLAEAASGNLAPEVLVQIMVLRIPDFLVLVLPLGLFIGILLAYGRFYVDSEMTVMIACGMSTKRLMAYTLVPALIVAVVVGAMAFYLGPKGVASMYQIFTNAKNRSGLEALVSGRFRIDRDTGDVTYIEKLTGDRDIMNTVFMAERIDRVGARPDMAVVLAETGRIEVNTDTGQRFLRLESGYHYIGKPGDLALEITSFDVFAQQLVDNEVSSAKYQRSDVRSTAQLIASSLPEDKATLQWRWSLVILVPIIALIAQGLSKTNHRRGRYVKMLPAFLLYILYLVVLSAARDAIGKGKIPVEIGLWWIHGVFLVIALGLLYGADLWRRLRSWQRG